MRIGVLDQHRRLPVRSFRQERRIGLDLALDALFLEDLLDVQHLLDLAADRRLVLELNADVFAQMHRAQFAVRDELRAAGLADLRVGLQRQQAFLGDELGGCHLVTHSKP